MKSKILANRFLWFWNSFFIILLVTYIGIGLVDAFNGGENFTKNWMIILFTHV